MGIDPRLIGSVILRCGALLRRADEGVRPYMSGLRGGDSADQIFLLLFAFGADGEGVLQA
jgi:hypothetical protein